MVKHLPEALRPEYSASYSSGQVKEQQPSCFVNYGTTQLMIYFFTQIERSSDFRMEQLRKYLESFNDGDPEKSIDPDVLKVG